MIAPASTTAPRRRSPRTARDPGRAWTTSAQRARRTEVAATRSRGARRPAPPKPRTSHGRSSSAAKSPQAASVPRAASVAEPRQSAGAACTASAVRRCSPRRPSVGRDGRPRRRRGRAPRHRDDERRGGQRSTVIGRLARRRGWRHAAMIPRRARRPGRRRAGGTAAMRGLAVAGSSASRGAPRRPPRGSAGDIDDVRPSRRRPAWRSPTFTAGRPTAGASMRPLELLPSIASAIRSRPQ